MFHALATIALRRAKQVQAKGLLSGLSGYPIGSTPGIKLIAAVYVGAQALAIFNQLLSGGFSGIVRMVPAAGPLPDWASALTSQTMHAASRYSFRGGRVDALAEFGDNGRWATP